MDKRRTSYVLPYATNYSVSSAGRILNISKNTPLADNDRVKITNNDGTQVWIYPKTEFNKLNQERSRGINRRSMSPEYPDYEIDIEGFVYNVSKPDVALAWTEPFHVRVYDSFGRYPQINTIKEIAKRFYNQVDSGEVFLETVFGEFGEPGSEYMCNHLPFYENRVQIIHYSIEHRRKHLLRYFKGYCVLEEDLSQGWDVAKCRTGEIMEKTYDAQNNIYFRMPVNLYSQDRETGKIITETIHVGITLEQLKLDYSEPSRAYKAPRWETFVW